MTYIITVGASPDPDDNYAVGPFASREEAESFIEGSHDCDDDPACLMGSCYGLALDDVEYARISYLNTPGGGTYLTTDS